MFEGNRYVVTRGTIDFLTHGACRAAVRHRGRDARPRSVGTRVTLGVGGTMRSFSLALGSDPPLPGPDIMLLLGTTTDVSNAELRALSPTGATQAEEALLRSAGRGAAHRIDLCACPPGGGRDAAPRYRADHAELRHGVRPR